jgi:hypothetical protein
LCGDSGRFLGQEQQVGDWFVGKFRLNPFNVDSEEAIFRHRIMRHLEFNLAPSDEVAMSVADSRAVGRPRGFMSRSTRMREGTFLILLGGPASLFHVSPQYIR